MHRGTHLTIIVLTVFLALGAIGPASAAEVTRLVEWTDTTCTVILTITGGPGMGITETIPAGAVMTSCSLPTGQYRASGDNLYFAVLGEPLVTYALKVREPAAISGIWVDFSDGSRGEIPRSAPGQTPDGLTKTATTVATPPVPQTTRAGASPAMLAVSLSALAIVGYLFGRGN